MALLAACALVLTASASLTVLLVLLFLKPDLGDPAEDTTLTPPASWRERILLRLNPILRLPAPRPKLRHRPGYAARRRML